MLKLKRVMLWEELNNLWSQHAEYSRGIGFEVTKQKKDNPKTARIKRVLISTIIIIYLTILICVALYEIKSGRRSIIKDVQFGLQLIGNFTLLFNESIIYYNQKDLIDLLDWSEGIYSSFDGADWCVSEKTQLYRNCFNIIRLLQKMPGILCVGLCIGAIVLTYVTGEGITPVLIYSTEGFYGKWYCFEIVFVLFSIVAYLIFRIVIVYVTTYILLVEHCSAQFRILGCAMRQLKKNDQTETLLGTIQNLHAELLDKVNVLDEIFTLPLLINESICVMAFTLVGALHLSGDGDTLTEVSGASAGLLFVLFPYFGQNIIDGADDFFLATYECDWLEFTLKEKKSLLLLMLMASRPIGLSSGGLHFSNYQELTDVS